MKSKIALLGFSLPLILLPLVALADSHRGQMDTDGILSPGEIPNPRIDYNRGTNNQNTHVGEVDTDGILSPGEIPNRNLDYSPRPNDTTTSGRCNSISRRDLPRPRIDIARVKQSGNVFGDKVKVTGSLEGTCLSEAGLFEEGRKVQTIPINTSDKFNRFEFEVKAHLDKRPEIRAYNVAGDRDIQYIEETD